MEPPYHLITTVGNQLFAAQGGDLHSFDLSNGSYLSGWQHPGSLNAQNGKHDILPENDAHPEDEQGVGKAEDGPRHEQPAAKRRKLSTGTDETTETTGDATETRNGEEGAEEPADGAEGLAKKPVGRLSKMATQDRAVITSLTATPDQQHLVTATGLDKTLRVFSHDEHGSLNLLSERALPKRPCAIAITADGQTILAADKFGDVFAFPLLPEPAPTAPKPSLAPPAGPTESPKPAQPFKPEADLSTVHSKKNRQALANQLRSASGNQPRFRQDAPQYTPVLGHVSMLTSIVVAASGSGRPCIITADRDEHIRVSRGLPQAHVIETYCLGHRHFVSRLCIPPQRPDMLVSGGGDDELFVWNWAAGRLVSTANLLGPVKKIHPSATRLAVLGIYASPPPAEDTSAHGAGCRVDVLCERVPAIFVFELLIDGQLRFSHTIALPGFPLDMASWRSPSAPEQQWLIAIDAHSTEDQTMTEDQVKSSIMALKRNGTDAMPSEVVSLQLQHSKIVTNGGNWTREQVESHLYTVESLRKTAQSESQDEGV